MATTASRPGLGEPGYIFDPFSQEFAEDPYPTYLWMRENAPVYHQPEMNFWVLSRYEDVWRAHRDAKTFLSKDGPQIERNPDAGRILLGKDAPDHGWAKAMMTKVFSAERMAALDGFIRTTAVNLLSEAYEKHGPDGEFDVVSEFGVGLPLSVISELLGIPVELRANIHHLANQMLARTDGTDLTGPDDARAALWFIFFQLTQERRKAPQDDPVSLLLAVEHADEDGVMHRLGDDEVANRFLEMTLAGHETVAKAIPSGTIALQLFPDQRARLAADLSQMPKVVQEVLRFDPPSQLQGRVTAREVMLHGVIIPADARVMLATGAATHDPDAFPDPDVFDIDRNMDSRTIAFGYGVHKCLGIHLAQREIAIALEELFARFPDWQVFPDRAVRVALTNVRGAASLPMVLGERR